MASLHMEIQRLAEETSFSGVVSIFKGQEEIFNQAFGFADLVNARPNNTETKFGIASGTKTFTALGIGALIDQGMLSLDTPIHDIFGTYLTWIDESATVEHLLTHTSGIYDYYDEELITDFDNFFVEIPWYRLETPSDYLPLFENQQPKFTPGERFSYSNGGYICLGIIIEKLTQQLYRDFIRNEVFAPAQMTKSGYYAFNQLPPNTANGYTLNASDAPETNIYNLPIRGASDGGAYTTSHDLQNFWRSVFAHRILSGELTAQFLAPHVNIASGVDYGYGFFISQVNGKKVISMQGGDAGVGFDSSYFPANEMVINLFSNFTNGEEDMRKLIFDNLSSLD